MEDTDMGDFTHDDAPVSEEDIARLQRASSPRPLGVMLTVFIAALIIMIGGLTSYYYYSLQKQGSGHEQNIRDNWDEIIVATTGLTNAFADVSDYPALFDDTKGSFQTVLSSSNGTLKDVSYNLQSISGYVFSGNLVITKMRSFLEDYIDYLRELQSVMEQGRSGLISDISSVDKLEELTTAMNEAYDNLLIADKNKLLEASLPGDLFKMADGVKDLMQKYLDDQKQKGEADDAEKTAAQAVVGKFMQAYIAKDADSMVTYLTTEAKTEFNRGVVEEATEIKSFEITDTRKLSDTKIELDARIKKETPDGGSITEKRKFVMLKKEGIWAIDSWPTA
ncbi:MAG: hypothetical protein V1807_01690 [Patescibacteria group bacterium]